MADDRNKVFNVTGAGWVKSAMADDLVVREINWADAKWTAADIIGLDYPNPPTLNLARAYLAVVAERDAMKDQHQQDRLAIETLADMAKLFEAQLAAMTAERDDIDADWLEKYDNLWRHGLALEAQLAAMTAERDEAREHAAHFWGTTLDLANDLSEREAQLATSEAARGRLQKLVNEQAEDDGLWFVAQFASEAYLQQELRTLHAAIEALAEPQEGES